MYYANISGTLALLENRLIKYLGKLLKIKSEKYIAEKIDYAEPHSFSFSGLPLL
jgi:hypothetical protein